MNIYAEKCMNISIVKILSSASLCVGRSAGRSFYTIGD